MLAASRHHPYFAPTGTKVHQRPPSFSGPIPGSVLGTPIGTTLFARAGAARAQPRRAGPRRRIFRVIASTRGNAAGLDAAVQPDAAVKMDGAAVARSARWACSRDRYPNARRDLTTASLGAEGAGPSLA